MDEYRPAYRQTLPLTLERFTSQLEDLRRGYVYATQHDDLLALDELFCRVVTLEHQVSRWDQKQGSVSRVQDSLRLLNRALKWAWLARDEEEHASGMYAEKIKEAVAILGELELFLEGSQPPKGMTQIQAEALAKTIKARLPQAEVEVREGEAGTGWIVEARNPRRGTSQTFQSAEEFEQLMQNVPQH